MTDELDREALLESLEGVAIGESPDPRPNESTDTGDDNPPEPIDDQTDTGDAEVPDESPDAKAEPEDADSRYEKLRKAEQRQNKAWQKIEDEKSEVRKLRDELDASRVELDADRLKIAEGITNVGSTQSPETLDKVAEKFRDEGEPELADEAERMANEARVTQSDAFKAVDIDRFKKSWEVNLNGEIAANPDLKDPETALYKTVKQLMAEKPVLATYETGFSDAVEVAKNLLKVGKVGSLETENKKLLKELNDLKQRTQLSGGDVPKRGKPKGFDDLDVAEQKRRVYAMCETADSGR